MIALLLLGLLWTGFSLRSETLKSAALEANVAALESEVARAEASVTAHEVRLESVRAEVGDLLSRVGALNSLVSSDVVPDDSLRVPFAPPSDVEPAPAD